MNIYIITSGDFSVTKNGQVLIGSPFTNDKTALDAAIADAVDNDQINMVEKNSSTPFILTPLTRFNTINKSLSFVGLGTLPRIVGGLIPMRFDAINKNLSVKNIHFQNNTAMGILVDRALDVSLTDCNFTTSRAREYALPSFGQRFWRGALIGNNTFIGGVTGKVNCTNCEINPETDPSLERSMIDPFNWVNGQAQTGTQRDLGISTTTAAGSISDINKNWSNNQWVGEGSSIVGRWYAIEFNISGILKQWDIISNTSHDLTVSLAPVWPRNSPPEIPPAGVQYKIIEKGWHTFGLQIITLNKTSVCKIENCKFYNCSNGINNEDCAGTFEQINNYSNPGKYGSHQFGNSVSAAGLKTTISFFTPADKGKAHIAENKVVCNGLDQVGIFCLGPNYSALELTCHNNEIFLEGKDFTDNDVSCRAGIEIRQQDCAYIAHNKINGHSKYAMIVGFPTNTVGTDNNLFKANSVANHKSIIADVYLTPDAGNNLVIGGGVETVIDEGGGNKITGHSPITIITGQIIPIIGASLNDGETFTLNNGLGSEITFEFDSDNITNAGHISVPYNTTMTQAQIGISIRNTINLQSTILNLYAIMNNLTTGIVDIYHQQTLLHPTLVPITETVANENFTVSGMAKENGIGVSERNKFNNEEIYQSSTEGLDNF